MDLYDRERPVVPASRFLMVGTQAGDPAPVFLASVDGVSWAYADPPLAGFERSPILHNGYYWLQAANVRQPDGANTLVTKSIFGRVWTPPVRVFSPGFCLPERQPAAWNGTVWMFLGWNESLRAVQVSTSSGGVRHWSTQAVLSKPWVSRPTGLYWTGTRWLMTLSGSPYNLAWSADGAEWTPYTGIGGNVRFMHVVCGLNGDAPRLLARVNGPYDLYYSDTDGQVWAPITNVNDLNVGRIAHKDGVWRGYSPTAAKGNIVRSSNAIQFSVEMTGARVLDMRIYGDVWVALFEAPDGRRKLMYQQEGCWAPALVPADLETILSVGAYAHSQPTYRTPALSVARTAMDNTLSCELMGAFETSSKHMPYDCCFEADDILMWRETDRRMTFEHVTAGGSYVLSIFAEPVDTALADARVLVEKLFDAYSCHMPCPITSFVELPKPLTVRFFGCCSVVATATLDPRSSRWTLRGAKRFGEFLEETCPYTKVGDATDDPLDVL